MAFFIPELLVGGSERQLVALAREMVALGARTLMISYRGKGTPTVDAVANDGVEYRVVPMRRNRIRFLRELSALLQAEKVDVLHTCLNSAQAYALATRAFGFKGRQIFGVGDSRPLYCDRDAKNLACDFLLFGGAVQADCYVFNSLAGQLAKAEHLSPERVRVIYNLIDAQRYRPRAESRPALRAALGLAPDTTIVGIVGNMTIHKNYPNFVRAAERIHAVRPDVHFVVVGNTDSPVGTEVSAMVRTNGLEASMHLLGSRDDVHRLVPGFDVFCSASDTEGSANVVGEAMACGLSCVVTDAGDSALLVGDTGSVVPRGDPARLADALLAFLAKSPAEREALGARARARMLTVFSTERALTDYLAVYRNEPAPLKGV